MSNPYKVSDTKQKVTPGGAKPVVVEPTPVEPLGDNPLEGLIDPPKPEGKSYGFYLSVEANKKLEELAKKNKCSKSKALDALLRSL